MFILPHYSKIRLYDRYLKANPFILNLEWYIINTILQNLIGNSIKYIDIEKINPKVDSCNL